MSTLRTALTQPKCSMPSISKVQNTRGKLWPDIDVFVWKEFTLETLNASYGHLLDEQINGLDFPTPNPALATVEVEKPEVINHLIHWSDRVLGFTLELARARLDIETGTALRRRVATADSEGTKLTIPTAKQKKGNIKVDHWIQLDTEYQPTLVVGLGRPSRSFPGRDLLNGVVDPSEETVWPLRQLANLCQRTRTRYGYILTEEDMMVCCFSTNDHLGESDKPKWSVAIRTIAWTKTGERQLTTDLALWWLCMLAISAPENRALALRQDTTPINAWGQPFKKDEQSGVWFRCHRFSQRVEEMAAPPLTPYEALDHFDFNAYFGPNQN